MNIWDFRKQCNSDQSRCLDALSEVFGGDHHLPQQVHKYGFGIAVNHYGSISTHDFDQLTRLVLAAHKYAIRIEIASSGPGMIKIIAHCRKHLEEGEERCCWKHHPTVGDLIARCQKESQ